MGRSHVEVLHASEVNPAPLSFGWPAGAQLRILSLDEQTGALTGVVSLPPGYRRTPGHLLVESEFFVLSGTLRIAGTVREFGYYDYAPTAATHEPWTVQGGCELLLMARGGPPEFVPEPGAEDHADARIQLDSELVPWIPSTIPGPPPGHFLKVLRHVEETGESVTLFKLPPRYDYPGLEYHECTQEVFYLEGDMWSGNGGVHAPGAYIWRPPFVTHGPFYSRSGCVMLIYTDSPLVDHYANDPRRTPEENRAEVLRKGASPDYLRDEYLRAASSG
jgi:hypothetical protein